MFPGDDDPFLDGAFSRARQAERDAFNAFATAVGTDGADAAERVLRVAKRRRRTIERERNRLQIFRGYVWERAP